MSASVSADTPSPTSEGDAIASDGMRFFRLFDKEFNHNRNYDYDPEQPLFHWGESYMLQAYVQAFELTREPAYGDFIKERIEKAWEARSDRRGIEDELRGRLMPAWCNNRYTDGKMHAHLVGTGMMTYPIARWCWIVKQDPDLREKYGTYADECLKELAVCLDAFDYAWREGPGKDEGYYKDLMYVEAGLANRLLESLRGGPDDGIYVAPYDVLPEPFNQQNALGRTYLMLWRVTGDERYLERTTKLANFLKNRMRIEDGAYIWPYAIYNSRSSTSDTSHAGLDVQFMCLCYESGIVFTREDISLLVARAQRIYDPKLGFAPDLTGQHKENAQQPSMFMWQYLGRYDPLLRSRLYQTYIGRWKRHEYNMTADQLAAISMVMPLLPSTTTPDQ